MGRHSKATENRKRERETETTLQEQGTKGNWLRGNLGHLRVAEGVPLTIISQRSWNVRGAHFFPDVLRLLRPGGEGREPNYDVRWGRTIKNLGEGKNPLYIRNY